MPDEPDTDVDDFGDPDHTILAMRWQAAAADLPGGQEGPPASALVLSARGPEAGTGSRDETCVDVVFPAEHAALVAAAAFAVAIEVAMADGGIDSGVVNPQRVIEYLADQYAGFTLSALRVATRILERHLEINEINGLNSAVAVIAASSFVEALNAHLEADHG